MIKAIIRFLFFLIPSTIIEGLTYILFERAEVIGTTLTLRKRWRPNQENIRKRILEDYLNKCFKQVNKESITNEKRLDKD